MNVIRKAIAELPGHWHQGEMVNPYNSKEKCGLGHLATLAPSDGDVFDVAACLISKVAGEQFPERKGKRYEDAERRGHSQAYCFADFNDHPDTTEEDVIMVFEKAAVLLDELVD